MHESQVQDTLTDIQANIKVLTLGFSALSAHIEMKKVVVGHYLPINSMKGLYRLFRVSSG